jgi:hypothetical protein
MRLTVLTTLLCLAACADDKGGTPDARMSTDAGGTAADTASDSATAYPLACMTPSGSSGSNGSVLPEGETCCTCTATGQSAPKLTCAPKVTTVKCNYKGTLYDDGAVFPADDGCNSCKCNPSGCMPGQWGCSLVGCGGRDAGPAADGPAPDAPVDQRRPDDGPPPDFLRPEHPGGFCPIDPPTPGTACTLEANQGCGYRPVCESDAAVNLYCSCPGGRWSCDDGGFCAR